MPFALDQSASFLADLLSAIPGFALPGHRFVQESEFSAAERKLLVHNHHMTVTLESHYGGLVSVKVLKRALVGDCYTREIELTCAGSPKPVLHGVVRIHLHFCKPDVRDLILGEKVPLGRILIHHGILTRIELVGLLRVDPQIGADPWFPAQAESAPGRLAVIHCDGQPAIELLEVVPPIPDIA